ncbi:MAG TPA: phage holin family protein [Gemmatimonadaceae bacterium]
MTARPKPVIDPEAGIPDLIRSLTDDSKRLVSDEVRLAKLEARDSLHRAARGGIWLALALGVAIVMFVALTVFLVTLIGRLGNGHMWIGAMVTGILELAVGGMLLKRGLTSYAQPSYTLVETRGALTDTAHWANGVRQR